MIHRHSHKAVCAFIATAVAIAALCDSTFTRAQQTTVNANESRAAPADPGPAIQVDADVYDFGTVNAGDLVKHTFTLTNTGDQTLEISNVHTSCGCTTAGDYARKIEAGQTGALPIQFNSANKFGLITKTIMVSSNAKNQPTVTLTIKGNVTRVNP